MKLTEYLQMENIGVQEFAKRCHLSRMAVYNVINKTCPPRNSTVKLIYDATNGLVTLEDLIYARKPKRKKLDPIKKKV